MRRTIFERINLEKTSGIICVEMMKKIQDAGFRIVEVPVHHFHRAFGKSQFFNFRRLLQDRPRPAAPVGTRSSSAASTCGRTSRPLADRAADPANRVYPTPPRL